MTPRRRSGGLALLRAAAALGLLNALPSVYWAFGGEALIATIGQWLIDFRDASPVVAGAGLLLVAVMKSAVAVLPVALYRDLGRPAQLGRTLCWGGAVVLIVYGTLGAAFSLSVLVGLLETPGAVDVSARMGHAFLWHPMLLLWGALLAEGLRRLPAPSRGPA